MKKTGLLFLFVAAITLQSYGQNDSIEAVGRVLKLKCP